MKLKTMAGIALAASALLTVSTSASAVCGIAIPSPASTVTPDGSGSYVYGYTLSGVSGSCLNFYSTGNYVINTFEVPYFSDAGITAIESPTGWTYAIVSTDTFGLGAETLVWSDLAMSYGVQPDTGTGTTPTLSGFGYTAAYSSVYAPAGVLLGSSPYLTGVDPALPGSPEALAAGLQPTTYPSTPSSVPEPSAALALLAGIGVLGFVRRRRA